MVHICIAALPLGTLEHQLIHAENLQKIGVEVCLLNFGPNHDLLHQSVSNLPSGPSVTRVNNEEALVNHLSNAYSKYVLFQSPYMEHYPDFLWKSPSSGYPPFVYLGYGINLSNWSEGHLKLPSFQYFRLVGQPVRQIHKEMVQNDVNGALLCGDALMQRVLERSSSAKPPVDQKVRLLWAPHWSQTWFSSKEAGYSRFLDCLEPMAELLESEPQLEITFRPHPMLRSALVEHDSAHSSVQREVTSTKAGLDRSPWREEFDKLSRHKRFRWSEADLVEDVCHSDLLVSEGVSILAYWAVTGKPLVVWRDSKSPDFNQTGMKILRLSAMAGSSGDLKKLVSYFCRRPRARRASPLRAVRARLNFEFVEPNPTIFAFRKLGILGIKVD